MTRTDGAYQVAYSRPIPAVAAISGFLGLLWSWAIAETGWANLPPDPATALIIGTGCVSFFVAHSLPFMRRSLRISEEFIDLPTMVWRPHDRVSLGPSNVPRITLYGTERAVTGFSVITSDKQAGFPFPFGKSATESFRRNLAGLQASGRLTVSEVASRSAPGGTGAGARTTTVAAAALAVAFALLVVAAASGMAPASLAGNLAALVLVITYSVVSALPRARVDRRRAQA